MNWLQKTAQQNIENLILGVASGNTSTNAALSQLQQMNVPPNEACEIINTMYQVHPEGKIALDELSRQLGCQNLMQQQPQQQLFPYDQSPPSDMEKPEMPSAEIE